MSDRCPLGYLFSNLKHVILTSKHKSKYTDMLAKLFIISGVLMLIGAIVYGVEFAQTFPSNSVIHLFVGFGLAIVAGVFSIIAGVLFAVAGNRQM